jgi:hypothetical protein
MAKNDIITQPCVFLSKRTFTFAVSLAATSPSSSN